MANKKTFTVIPANGLNVREEPSMASAVLRVLKAGTKIESEDREAPEDWMPVKGGGFVLRKFVK